VALPGLVGIAAMLLNGWHSDKTQERRWHTVVPLICAGVAHVALSLTAHHFSIAMALLIFGGGLMFSYYPIFWSMPTMVLSESAAAASFGLINSIGHTGGFVGPYLVGYLNRITGASTAAFAFIGVSYLLAGSIISVIKIRNPLAANPSPS
jgi:MFS transporter, ACS family, tartrate transporter